MTTKFDKATARRFTDEALALLAPLSEKYGVKLEGAGGMLGLGGDSFTMKIEATVKLEEGKAPAAFAQYAKLFGIKAEDYGRTFRNAGRTFKLVDLAPNRPRFPVGAEEVGTGRKFKFPEEVLKRLDPVAA